MLKGTTTRSPTSSLRFSRPTSTTSPMKFVPQHVARLHSGDVPVIEMEIRSADRGRDDLDDGVARRLDPGIGDRIATHVVAAMPDQRFHFPPPRASRFEWRGAGMVPTGRAPM